MTQTHQDEETIDYELYPLVTGAERLETARSVFGTWKQNSEKEIDKALKRIREEWDRPLSDIR